MYVVWDMDTDLFFYIRMFNFSSTICWKDNTFLHWSTLAPFKHQLIILWLYFWIFCSFPFIYILILSPALNCLHYCSFTVSLEIRSCEASNFVLVQAILAFLVPILSRNFRITLSVFYEVWDWDCIESKDQLGENKHLNNIESSDPQSQYSSPFI